ncbi:MAG TPA: helix-turn-helix domain-containing protein [Amycolatopsis sp.]|uniref:TetR/AcrR family transcriptional regulator n=1 Tax=Amycolatopsis sp. TaxID=37632 RepID=UPI002B45E548|nr:helix-turn-helix domain-containing protein [Amycolatopsis sp.]HKS47865.1 helix-turn-helix domain-containing protein [Amycolatopsis sp.]
MAGRRSDTRERIQQVALALFAEQGYEKTSLREIAEKLNVTKAALYYHFKTKEDIVASLFEDLAVSLDEILEWVRAQDDPARIREKLLRRVAKLVEGSFVRLWQFIQENQPTLKELHVGNPLAERMTAVLEVISAGEQDPSTQLRARLALMALVIGNNPEVLADERRGEVALDVALELASPRGRKVDRAT